MSVIWVWRVKVDATHGITWPALYHHLNSSSLLIYFQIKDFVFRTIFALPLLCAKYAKWNRDRSVRRSESVTFETQSDLTLTNSDSRRIFSPRREENFSAAGPKIWPRMESDRGPPGLFSADQGDRGQQVTSNGAPHVRRLRTLKRKKEEKEMNRNQVKLDRVLGLTVTSNASLATAPATGE